MIDKLIADEDLLVKMFNLAQFSLQIAPINILHIQYTYTTVFAGIFLCLYIISCMYAGNLQYYNCF